MLHRFSWSFWYLVIGQALQSLALSAFSLGLIFLGFEESNPTGIGLVLAMRTLPTMMISLVGGVIADKYDRVKLASRTLIVSALLQFILAFCLLRYGLGWQVYVISFITGLVSAFGAPSLYALLPSIVPAENNVRANAIARGSRNVMSVIGPLLVGITIPTFGHNFLFYMVAVLMGVSGGFINSIRLTSPLGIKQGSDEAVPCQKLGLSGLNKKYPWFVLAICFWSALLFLESGAAAVTLPFVFLETWTQSQWALTLSVTSLGYIIGAIYLLRFPARSQLLSLSFLVFPLSIFPFLAVYLELSFPIILVCCLIAGIGLEVSGSLWGSVLQTHVSQSEIGRVSSIDYAISFGLVPVAYIVYGMLSDVYSGDIVLVVSAGVIGILSCSAAWCGRESRLLDFSSRKP
ncbi:MAG: MFS transporter [Corynebacterium sp.]|uniref:MFS transporter n=1 Tax=Corynebacterium sp. TaxID=1720 RepID=UPI0026DDC17B|nr:MFS transporter [Corynebacterium sp.]MDO5099172.1 MFS transporter [Corynebacterium sp.]